MTDHPFVTVEFATRVRVGRQAALVLVPSALMLLVLIATLVLTLVTPPSATTSRVPGLMGGIMAVPVLGFLYGLMLLRSAVRVVLDDQGVTVYGLAGSRRVAWRDVAELRRDQDVNLFGNFGLGRNALGKGGTTREVLSLRDPRGRKLATLSDLFADFPTLVAEVEARSSAARGGSTYREDQERTRLLRKQKRTARQLGAGSAVFATACLIALPFAWLENRNTERLQREAAKAQGKVLVHQMFNVTPRVTYEFVDPSGVRHERDTALETAAWSDLKVGDTVAVRYLADEPDFNRLETGEIPPDRWQAALLVPLLAVFALGSLSVLLMSILGYADIRVTDGRLHWVRIGEVEVKPLAAPDGARVPISLPPVATTTPLAPIGAPPPKAGGHIEVDAELDRPALPPGIRALAIANIAFGVLCIGWNSLKILGLVWLTRQGPTLSFGQDTYSIEISQRDMLLALGTHGAEIILALMLTISAVGLFRVHPWGRITALLAATGQLLCGALAIANLCRNFSAAAENADGHVTTVRAAGIGVIVWVAVTMVYPLIVVAVLGGKSARNTFRSAPAAAPEPTSWLQ